VLQRAWIAAVNDEVLLKSLEVLKDCFATLILDVSIRFLLKKSLEVGSDKVPKHRGALGGSLRIFAEFIFL
jgi:hypothetical protein